MNSTTPSHSPKMAPEDIFSYVIEFNMDTRAYEPLKAEECHKDRVKHTYREAEEICTLMNSMG